MEGQIPSSGLVISLRTMRALAVTCALVELEALVPELEIGAAAAADIELCVVFGAMLLLCAAPSVYTAVDVEVEVTVT